MIYFRKYFSCDYYTMYLTIFFTFFTSFQNSIKAQQSSHKDVKYLQEYAVKYDLGISVSNNSIELKKVFSDRNGVIQVFSSKGLMKPNAGQFLHPGKLVSDISYRPIADKNIKLLSLYKNQFVYADDRVVLSNAWAGKLYAKHGLTNIKLIAGGLDFSFLLSDGKYIELLKDSSIISRVKADEEVLDILYDTKTNKYLVLSAESVSLFSEKSKSIEKIFSGNGFTCFALAKNNSEIYIGTHDGYIVIDAVTKKQKGEIKKELPSTNISIVNEIEGQIWFGSDKGAFRLNKEGKYDYFASKRWIPSDKIVDIQSGADHSILILTDKGLGIIHAESMSLYDKAMFYEKQVRQRHIRNGFNSTLASMTNGDIGTGSFHDDDNDGLWTSMYLAAEAFRYAVTHSAEALQNCRESFDAMERLYSINHIPGFPSRSFERTGYNKTNKPTTL